MLITMMTAGLLALLVVGLGLRVSASRRATGISLGDGGNPELASRIRAHGNAVETIPLALILLLLAEWVLKAHWSLPVLALVLLVSRILHPIGVALPAPNIPRVAGILGTWGVTAILALMLLWQAVGSWQ